jgi:predicted AAA+ superfamily ATPase
MNFIHYSVETHPKSTYDSVMIRRNITEALVAALEDRPVVLLNGARQTGKSTLVTWLASGPHRATYLTFDDARTLAAALADPPGFVAGLTGPTVLDEVQKAIDLFPAIKRSVDRDRRPGRFLLTGSAEVLLLPGLSESLAGRMEVLALWPLSQGEIENVRERFVDALFADTPLSIEADSVAWPDLVERMLRGGFPEIVGGGAKVRRAAWFDAYLTTILQREVRDLSQVEGLVALPRLLGVLAARATGLVNFAELSRSTGIPQTTLKRYMALLGLTFVVETLPAWTANFSQRLIKSPKLLLADSGLLGHLRAVSGEQLAAQRELAGPILETFVAMELRKQITWSETQPRMFHFRTAPGQEVDIVLEARGGRLVGIEVKASATVGPEDFKSLRLLADATGKRFRRGIVLYGGGPSLPFGEKFHALPVTALWRLGARPHKPGKQKT